jgi:hypothetical protein
MGGVEGVPTIHVYNIDESSESESLDRPAAGAIEVEAVVGIDPCPVVRF